MIASKEMYSLQYEKIRVKNERKCFDLGRKGQRVVLSNVQYLRKGATKRVAEANGTALYYERTIEHGESNLDPFGQHDTSNRVTENGQ